MNQIVARTLKIGEDLTIFFDDNDKPGYHSASGRDMASARDELLGYAGFIATWLEEADEQKVGPLNLSQQKLRKMMTPLARQFKQVFRWSGQKTSRKLNEIILEMQPDFPELTLPQMEAVVRLLVDGEK